MVHQYIHPDMEKLIYKKEITKKELMHAAGISDKKSFYDFLNESAELNFFHFLKIVKHVSSENEYSYMDYYIRGCKRPLNIRMGLEYAAINGLTDLLKYLIETKPSYNNQKCRQALIMYDYVYRYMMNRTDKEIRLEILTDIRLEKFSCYELNILYRVLEAIHYFYQSDFRTMRRVSENLLNDIEHIKIDFIREAYMSRILTIYALASLSSNKITESRDYCWRVIDISLAQKHVGTAYHTLGMTYFYSDYQLSMKHLKQAQTIYENTSSIDRMKRIFNDFCFVSNIHKITNDYPTHEISEVAHRLIISGQSDQALSILKDISDPTPYTYYYLGLALDDEQYYLKSLKSFIKNGDLYAAYHLPLPKLQNKKVDVTDVFTLSFELLDI